MVAMVVTQPLSGLRRVPLLSRCLLRGSGVDTLVLVCNVSLRGTSVAVGPVPKVGEPVVASFQLPWWEQPMTIDAVVCWDNSGSRAPGLPAGCGLEFLAPTWSDQGRIEAVVWAFGRSVDRHRRGCDSALH